MKKEREKMITEQLQARGIDDEIVLNAFQTVPREKFVPIKYKEDAYADRPLPIGHNVTISQPYIVAKMCQILNLLPDDKVLDIGTGSGYQAAILAEICKEVVTVERVKELSESAEKTLSDLGYENVTVIHGDGAKGYKAKSPYDAIKVAAATDTIPAAWKKQLAVGGRIVFPSGRGLVQQLTEIRKRESGLERVEHGSVRFVPLIED